MKKLDKVLLIDDSKADNFIHKRVIKKADITDNIIVKYSGQSALEYLTTKVDGHYPTPELVFLDINMPGMDGWEFLEEYEKLEEAQRAGVIVCMLTTSIAEKDQQRANNYAKISSYRHKPLTDQMLFEILETFFPDRFSE
ncbi:MAG: response regulator [Saprospiraceae bacterium]